MDIYQFMSDSPYLTFFVGLPLAFIVGLVVEGMFQIVFCLLPNRILRHWNIRKHGYPPAHCDADGDFKTENKEN